MSFPEVSWLPLVPTLIITGAGFLVLLADMFMDGPDRDGLGWLGIAGAIVAAIASATMWNQQGDVIAGSFIVDNYALFFNLVFCLAAGLTLLTSMDYLETIDVRSGEYYALILFATAGMMTMAAATDLIVLFLGLEVMSIAAYVLAGIWRRELRSSEAAVKYFLLGAFATGFLLFGIALFYGAFGTTALGAVREGLANMAGEQRVLALGGMGLLAVGFGFKVAAVPFHSWAPDVYEGSPTSVTGWMAVGVKAAAFAAFARVFLHFFDALSADWTGLLWIIAALTMTYGNVAALLQRNIKRMLAYSSIAHAGYILVGMVAAGTDGGAAILYYLLAYALMNLGAFTVVAAIARKGEFNEELDDFAGLGFKQPFLGASMSIFMLSLAGIPAFAGFTGKLFVFSAAVKSGYVGLAVLGVLNSVLSVYYYAGVLVKMYMTEGKGEPPPLSQRPHVFAVLLITAIGTVFLGIFPGWAFDLAANAFRSLG